LRREGRAGKGREEEEGRKEMAKNEKGSALVVGLEAEIDGVLGNNVSGLEGHLECSKKS